MIQVKCDVVGCKEVGDLPSSYNNDALPNGWSRIVRHIEIEPPPMPGMQYQAIAQELENPAMQDLYSSIAKTVNRSAPKPMPILTVQPFHCCGKHELPDFGERTVMTQLEALVRGPRPPGEWP